MTRAALVLAVAAATAASGATLALASGGPPPAPTAAAPPHTVVAHGTAVAEVARKGLPQTDPAIERAVQAARAAALPRALRAGRRDAEALAAVSGLRLGALVGVTRDMPPPGWWDQDAGAFGPGRWCGRLRSRRACRPPREVSVRIAATYAAEPSRGQTP